MLDIKGMVRDGKKVNFLKYQGGNLWYQTENGFEFPVPIEETGTATFLATDKAMLFMRYIRKEIAHQEEIAELAAKGDNSYTEE